MGEGSASVWPSRRDEEGSRTLSRPWLFDVFVVEPAFVEVLVLGAGYVETGSPLTLGVTHAFVPFAFHTRGEGVTAALLRPSL